MTIETCEICKHFDIHPFIRDGIYDSYCMHTNQITDVDNTCNTFEKFKYYEDD